MHESEGDNKNELNKNRRGSILAQATLIYLLLSLPLSSPSIASPTKHPLQKTTFTKERIQQLKWMHNMLAGLRNEKASIKQRQKSAIGLGRMGPKADLAVIELLHYLRTSSSNALQTSIIRTLGKIGPKASLALPELVKAWRKRDVNMYKAILEAVVRIDRNKSRVLSYLQKAYYDKGKGVRLGSVRALGHLGKLSIPLLKRGLKSKDSSIRITSCVALYSLGYQQQQNAHCIKESYLYKNRHLSPYTTALIPRMSKQKHFAQTLIKLIGSNNHYIRRKTSTLIKKIDTSKHHSELLTIAKQTTHSLTHITALMTLARTRALPDKVIPYIVSKFTQTKRCYRGDYLKILLKYRKLTLGQSSTITRVLIKFGPTCHSMLDPIYSIGLLKPSSPQAIAYLVKQLKNPKHRETAIESLGNIGPKASTAVQQVWQLYKPNFDPKSKNIVANSLYKLGPKALTQILTRPSRETLKWKIKVANLIGWIGEPYKRLRPLLLRWLSEIHQNKQTNHKNTYEPSLQSQIVWALKKMNWRDKKAVIFFSTQLNSKDHKIKYSAIEALGGFTTLYGQSSPTCKKLLSLNYPLKQSINNIVQLKVAYTLSRIGLECLPYFPIGNKQEKRTAVRYALAWLQNTYTNKQLTHIYKKEKDNTIKHLIIKTLGKINNKHNHSIPIFIKIIKQSNRQHKTTALRALARFGSGSTLYLMEYTKDLSVANQAIDAFQYNGAQAEIYLKHIFDHGVINHKRRAMASLAQFKNLGTIGISMLEKGVYHNDKRIRQNARLWFEKKYHTKKSIEALYRILSGSIPPKAKEKLAISLASKRKISSQYGKIWRKLLRSRQWKLQVAACRALGKLSKIKSHDKKRLKLALHSKKWQVRLAALTTLRKVLTTEKVWLFLYQNNLFKDLSWQVRRTVLDSLPTTHPNINSLTRQLLSLLNDKHKSVRTAAYRALCRIKNKEPKMIQGMLSSTRTEKIRTLAFTCLTTTSSIQLITPLLTSKNRKIAHKIIKKSKFKSKIYLNGESTTALLQSLWPNASNSNKIAIINALTKINPKSTGLIFIKWHKQSQKKPIKRHLLLALRKSPLYSQQAYSMLIKNLLLQKGKNRIALLKAVFHFLQTSNKERNLLLRIILTRNNQTVKNLAVKRLTQRYLNRTELIILIYKYTQTTKLSLRRFILSSIAQQDLTKTLDGLLTLHGLYSLGRAGVFDK